MASEHGDDSMEDIPVKRSSMTNLPPSLAESSQDVAKARGEITEDFSEAVVLGKSRMTDLVDDPLALLVDRMTVFLASMKARNV